MATNKPNDKALDVAKPGKSLPDESARPVIVSHRPIVQDPTIRDDAPSSDVETKDPEKPVSNHSKIIQPLPEDVPSPDTTKEEPAEPEKTPAETTETSVPTPKSAPAPASSETAEVDALADQAGEKTDKKTQDKLTEEEKKKQGELQKLVQSKKYFVPIGQVTRRRQNRRAIILFVLFIVVIGGLYAAADAEVIKLPFDVPVHIIKK